MEIDTDLVIDLGIDIDIDTDISDISCERNVKKLGQMVSHDE